MDKYEIKKLTGLRIKELRKLKGYTQEQLAELTDIGERNLSKIECGKNFISAETLVKLSNALNVQPYEIFKFEHLEEEEVLQEKLIRKIENKEVDIKFLFKILWKHEIKRENMLVSIAIYYCNIKITWNIE